MSLHHALSARLRQHRGCYTQIAQASGISASWLSMFARGQRGKRPSYDLIQRLMHALDAFEAGPAKIATGKARGKPCRKVTATKAKARKRA